ncbi:S8 family serine peptidase [Streptomyces sp. NRRL S-1022]|uniref:S8 family serine peptidase n=1 Tax=Streptomyces sp. NRRL S-1022 TaxID=1463880 RepID=UPI0004C27E0B|nr:S8 family serine peptidase [Streptomyces sp. NRRL S-1022]
MMSVPGEFGDGEVDGALSEYLRGEAGEPTGRYVLTLADDVVGDANAMRATCQSLAGVSNVVESRELSEGAAELQELTESEAVLYPTLGLAVVASAEDRLEALSTAAAEDERIEAVEPELMVHALQQPGVIATEYLRGYRDAASALYEHANGGAAGVAVEAAPLFADTAAFTWGLQAVRADTSRFSGQGVPVAILDTGFTMLHPDFAGRRITSRSFVTNQAPDDGHGHGTHCTGTTSGPQRPPGGTRRYGIAHNDNIFIGKVLDNQGSGTDGQILAGIEWAVNNHCRVISMSLGANVPTVSAAYEAAGRRALANNCLIIAAAGNNADRAHGSFGFVGRPANSPSIMAVGAVDSQLDIANFSARSNPVVGGQVDIVGPGVNVYSSWKMPDRYKTISGTSMATPHVAGCAALWAQATGMGGAALYALLIRSARRLPISSVDVGAGLVQAPQ